MPAQEIERSSKQALLSVTVSLKDRSATKYPSPFLSHKTSGNGFKTKISRHDPEGCFINVHWE